MRTIILDRKQFPKCIQQFECVKGICVGNCIDISTSWDDKFDAAHAHCSVDDHQGFICLRYKFQLREKLTLLHEVAHLLVNKSNEYAYHGVKWRETVVKIGGTYKAHKSLSRTKNPDLAGYIDHSDEPGK